MKYELSHDSLARQVFDKASTEARTRRKVERYVRERYAAYQERGAKLTQDDVDFVWPYLSQVNITAEEATFLEQGRKELKRRQRNVRWLIIITILALLSLTAWAQLESQQAEKSEEQAKANAERAEANAAEALAAKRQDSLRAIDLGIALEVADAAKRADSLKAIELGLALNEANLQRLAAERRALELQALSLAEEAAKLPREDKEVALRLAQAAYEMCPTPPAGVQKKLADIFYRQLGSSEEIPEPLPTINFTQGRESFRSCVARYSPDRQFVLLISFPDIYLYDTDGQLLWMLPDVGQVWDSQFSPNSQLIAFTNGKKVEVWNTDRQHLATFANDQNSILSLEFSPEGKRLATCAINDSIVQVWRLDKRDPLLLEGHLGRVYSASFSADGRYIATASEDQTAIIWDSTGQIVAHLPDHGEAINRVQFSPTHSHVFTTAEAQVGRLWSIEGELLATFDSTHKVHLAQFSPDGERILTSSFRGMLGLWDLEGNLLSYFDDCRGTIRDLCFSPDGRRIGAASVDNRAKVWDIANKSLVVDLVHRAEVISIQFSQDGQQVLTSSRDGTAKLWPLTPPLLLDLNPGRSNQIAFAPDGQSFMAAGSGKSTHIWNRDGALLRTIDDTRGAYYLPRSNELFTNGLFNAYRRDLSGNPIVSWPNPDSVYFNNFAIAPNEQIFCNFYPRRDGEPIRLYDRNGKLLRQWQAHEKRTTSVEFSSNGQRILTYSIREEAKLWNLDGELLLTIQTKGQFKAAVFSPDGQHIVTRETHGTIKIWDLEGNLVAETPRSANYRSVQFSPDGQYLAISDTENLYLWDMKSWTLKIQIPNAADSYVIQFSPDGQLLLTRPSTKSVQIWNLDGELIAEFNGHTGLNVRTVFAPDGHSVLSNSDDQTLKLWPLPQRIYNYLKNEAAIPELTDEQRKLYGID